MLLFGILFGGTRLVYTFTRISFAEYLKYNSNFIPLKTILTYIRYAKNNTINLNIILENLLGNILMFFPMGLFLPCIFMKMHRFVVFVISVIAISLSAELLQLICQVGSFDVDDIILNFVGALLVYMVVRNHKVVTLLKKIYIVE